MNTLKILVVWAFAFGAMPAPQTVVAEGDRQASISVAQTSSGCCRKWSKRWKTWQKVRADRKKCAVWNKRFDKKEKSGSDLLKKKGAIWWDKKCDNRE